MVPDVYLVYITPTLFRSRLKKLIFSTRGGGGFRRCLRIVCMPSSWIMLNTHASSRRYLFWMSCIRTCVFHVKERDHRVYGMRILTFCLARSSSRTLICERKLASASSNVPFCMGINMRTHVRKYVTYRDSCDSGGVLILEQLVLRFDELCMT